MSNIFRIMTTFNSQGKATRRDFLTVTFIVPLVYSFIYIVLTAVTMPFAKTIGADIISSFILIITLGIILHYILISYVVLVKRLHDTGKSGAYYFVTFIPMVGPFILFVLLLSSPTVGPNIYGEDPREQQ